MLANVRSQSLQAGKEGSVTLMTYTGMISCNFMFHNLKALFSLFFHCKKNPKENIPINLEQFTGKSQPSTSGIIIGFLSPIYVHKQQDIVAVLRVASSFMEIWIQAGSTRF